MKAVIAEKPSVAREIASILGATEKKEGYQTGNGYCVTWAFGHLVGLGMPEDYGVSGFQKVSLPMLPDPFILTVQKVRKDKAYVMDTGAHKQLKVIEKIFDQCDSIIVATDAGREGELIFRYIYDYLKCNKPFQRLWISSLTEKAIRSGFDHLKKGSDFDGLHNAAQSRSRADWLVGINATQALSIAAGDGIYSLGRVQTPTLALICQRYLEHQKFKIQKYWQIQLSHTKSYIDFRSKSVRRWDDKKGADEILKSIERKCKEAEVISVVTKTIKEQPPLLFDLTGLQKEANIKLNFSADETLNIAQSLYEKKFISYPRTGSMYISEDLWTEIPELVRALVEKENFKKLSGALNWGRFNKRIVNDLGVTDHHGLLITEKIPSTLSAKENAVYDMIAFRLLESLSQDCTKESIDVKLQVLHYDFEMKGSKILELGWRSIKGLLSEREDESVQELPDLKEGNLLKIKDLTTIEKTTKAPLLYTEAGLLSAMESAGRQIEDEQARRAIREVGIGTPATRASIIETLFSRNYVKRVKKSLVPTEKGLQVYDLVKDKKIADVAMTADWELAFQKIEKNELNASAFQEDIEVYTTAITSELLQVSFPQQHYIELTCPKCRKQHLIIREKIVKCPDELCGWLQFRNVCGVQLTMVEIEKLVKDGKTSLIKGMKSKSGKKFDAYMILNDQAVTSFQF